MDKIKVPSGLAFSKKISPSDAVLFSGSWADRDTVDAWSPLRVQDRALLGTASHRQKVDSKNGDVAAINMKLTDANPQRGNFAALPSDSDTLKASFTVKYQGGVGVPHSCSEPEFRKKLSTIVGGYVKDNGFKEISRRYAHNLANARFLWRNREWVEQIEVRIDHIVAGEVAASWVFDSNEFNLGGFEAPSTYQSGIDSLAALLESGFLGKKVVLLEVSAFARMGRAQEVFPSQEMVIFGKGDERKGKILYSVDGMAGMHSQKIGNALRVIDDWHPFADENGPIAIETYGSVTRLSEAFRRPDTKKDFYSLLDGWVIKDKVPTVEQQHYLMAVLVRGGVFGQPGNDKVKKEA